MSRSLQGKQWDKRVARADRDREFLDVLRAEHDMLARIAFGMLKNEDDANEVLAEAVTNVYAKWRQDKVDDLAPYLTRAVTNTAIGRTRKRKAQLRALDLLAAQTETTSDAPEATVDSTAVREHFEALGDDCRTIIQLRIIDQRPVKDVADELLISQGTVKSRLSRCLQHLGRKLGA